MTDFGEDRMDHATHWETSILMYLYPDIVDAHQIQDDIISGHMEPEDWESLGISGKDRNGNANKQLGKLLVYDMAGAIGKKAEDLLGKPKFEGKLSSGPKPEGEQAWKS
ncbi:hypothetical protein ACFL0D_02260 [Thermoproteota archaeon]